jgi:hypothetical protein
MKQPPKGQIAPPCVCEGCSNPATWNEAGHWNKFCSKGCYGRSRQHGASFDRDVLVEGLREDVRRYRTAYEKLVGEREAEDRIIGMLRHSVQSFPRLPADALRRKLQTPKSGSKHYEVPVLLRGDQQIGEEITSEETFGINHYNFATFLARLEMLEERVLDILTNHQNAEFHEIVVMYLGDNISGRIHEELQKYGHQHVMDQVYLGALAESLFLYRLARFGKFQKVRVSCVSGNHGRLDKAKESKRYYKNFDYLFHNMMALALRNVPEIEFHIPRCLFTIVEVAGHHILQSHGHELPPSSLGIPLYSINRASAAYQELMVMADQVRFSHWVLAHFHRPMELDNSIVNGTMAGLSEFGIGKFKPIVPMQRLMGFHSKWGKAWEYSLRLDKGPERPSIYTFDQDMETETALQLFEQRVDETEDKAAA